MNLQSLHESESLSRTLPRQNKHKCLEIIANIGRFDWQIYALYVLIIFGDTVRSVCPL